MSLIHLSPLIRSMFWAKKVDLSNRLTLHSIGNSEWDQLKNDLSYEKTLHILTFQVGSSVQRSAEKMIRGCKKFVPFLACLFCLALPRSCLARLTYFFGDLCIEL